MNRPPATDSGASEFVRSCVNFKTNVEFTDVDAYKKTHTAGLASTFVVILGTHAQLREDALKELPFYCPAVAEAIQRVKKGETYAVLAEGVKNEANERFVRVLVGEVPSEASRTNCSARPDVVVSLLSAALEEIKGPETKVDVFVCSTAALAIAVAAARSAKRNFTAKEGLAARGYCDNCVRLTVVFPTAPNPSPSELVVVATSTQLCQRLVDAPTNLLNTATFAEVAQSYAKELGCAVDVICGEELRERGYGGIYSVGKCAAEAPRLVTLSYKPKDETRKKVALVGKGIVYDSGGLSLKPTNFMTGMKRDMGGAAAVFCGFLTAVRLQMPIELSCTLCLAENAIGPDAYRNDDILTLKSGKTVEVNNTDAEGRLVLGDGVFHATHEISFKPDVLVDMATLTGAQGIATGHRHAGIFVNDEEEELSFLKAGRVSGETCFPVLYCPEYHVTEFRSPVADMRNSVKQVNNASVSCAGHFVANHLSPDFKGKHIHVDMAFPAFENDKATGFGPALLMEYLRNLR
ncbi:aminopeptidase, putative [Trypanosoma cruzi]|uniref:Aminopeptidase, putative n=3 Tax=Trypanosoma cruzi TaxID=5693 RepID=Q4DZJ3_TRYCC|nr:aminopeptidase, putative [Trypanosoma cruzi]EAN97960.1 aminopeptidase, putative [Trypanosoma cruzi]|eukprot:XP_819811.1 aminopeptidase [Trypanosoma cruzi strain CL Brener]